MLEHARWIWTRDEGDVNVYARFEEPFYAENTEGIAAEVSVSGEYALWINDQLAGFGQFGDWLEEKTVNRHDISQFCRAGKNDFRLIAWHMGRDTSVSVAGPARVCFEVDCGGRPLLVSSENTRCVREAGYVCGEVPLITGQLGYSFLYDARRENAVLGRARAVEAPQSIRERETSLLNMEDFRQGKLAAQGIYFETKPDAAPAERLRRAAMSMRFIEEISDEQSYAADSGDGLYLIYDLGRESSGFLSFDMELDEDAEILIGFGEHLKDLRVRSDLDGRGFCAVYHAKRGRNPFTHWYRRWGCRYIQLHIAARRVRVHRVGLIPVVYPVPKMPDFRCGDALHQRIFEVGADTLRLCMHDHYEDCPWREQALYAMDSRIQMLCGYYAFGEKKLPLASLRLLAGGLGEDGLMELCAPAKVPITIPAFSLAYSVELWEYMLYTGDATSARPLWRAAMAALDAAEARVNARGCVLQFVGLRYWNFYEWQDGLDGNRSKQSSKPCEDGLLTAWYAVALDAAEKGMRALGEWETAEALRRRRVRVVGGMETFWDEQRGEYAAFIVDGKKKTYCELMQSLALLGGACAEERAAALRERLASQNDMIPVTLNDALLRYRALLQDEKRYADFVFDDVARTWGAMLFEGATSFWETALGDRDFHLAGSLCHGWSAVPVYLYYAYGLGLRPDGVGQMARHPVMQTRLGDARGGFKC